MKFPTEVMSGFWTTIEPYLDVESLVSASKACRLLHDLVIDPASGKIKASALKIERWSSCIEAYNAHKVDWQSAPVRIRHYGPSAINAVLFQFLSRLQIGFPAERTVWNGEEWKTENAHVVALPMLAQKLNDATNLEELALDVSSLIKHECRLLGEEEIRHPHLYSMLGENLARSVGRSRRLKRLRISNELEVDESQSKFSSGFLAAMVPVLRAGVDCIEEVTVLFGDVPLSRDHHPDAGVKFFEALFSLRRLKALRIQLRCVHVPLLNALVDASAAVGTFPSRSLEEISVQAHRPEGVFACRPKSIAPFLSLCRDVPSLRQVMFSVPFWDEESVSALSHLLHRKPLLDYLAIRFYGYADDESEDILNCLLGFLQSRTSLSGLRVKLSGLGYVDEESAEFWALQRYCSRDGRRCLRDDDAANGDWMFDLR